MAKYKSITYECLQCGNEINVTTSGESELSPIYCCGTEIIEIAVQEKKSASPKKKPVKKPAKKKTVTKKKTATKKK